MAPLPWVTHLEQLVFHAGPDTAQVDGDHVVEGARGFIGQIAHRTHWRRLPLLVTILLAAWKEGFQAKGTRGCKDSKKLSFSWPSFFPMISE